MLKSFTVVGPNNYTVYHIQAIDQTTAREIFRDYTGMPAFRCYREG